MKNKIKFKTIRILSIALIAVSTFYFASPNFLNNSETEAVGDLTIDWGAGITPPDPIFTVTNAAPGDSETRSVLVTNGAPSSRPVGVRGVEQGGDTIKDILEIKISNGSGDLYGGTLGTKTLSQFFIDSAGPDGIFLVDLASASSVTLDFKIDFPVSADNAYQNKSAVFDLIIGISINLPDACDQIDLLPTPIIGTAKAETLNGTQGNDLIMGLEGADKINGLGGDDCILGGEGADKINGNNGKDAIFGEGGADTINGNNGDDTILGGKGGDTLKGENGQDKIFGNEDADTIDGGNGEDYIEGNEAADTLNGGNQKDIIFGNEAADTLRGGNGNDNLDGGLGVDTANGNNGSDTCDAETRISCEL
ncbi:MAG: NHL repeat-containing protein [Candidatus Curtissbacteria bacterium GW2011_GWA1_41_11]|uniref:NHL repeat-containing protein n=1 Tax=Candidatus Curtissbacteria bacterium GW2011_GWA1_41_11 TaxID=1618409 RepID=A0A0G0XFX7_9BACT|nr:MAG: NHL repeat-containing protein [Candidatus Curtissbacteria bacterium GW2011_GWA1_41_11]